MGHHPALKKNHARLNLDLFSKKCKTIVIRNDSLKSGRGRGKKILNVLIAERKLVFVGPLKIKSLVPGPCQNNAVVLYRYWE